METHVFKSSYFRRMLKGDYNPFTPNIIIITPHTIEYRRRNWYLISSDSQSFHFQNVIGITIDKHLIGASLIIQTSGNAVITISGFTKRTANRIKELCHRYISANTQRGTTESLANAIGQAINLHKNNIPFSVADELTKLKTLLDRKILTQEEFDAQKKKLLNQ